MPSRRDSHGDLLNAPTIPTTSFTLEYDRDRDGRQVSTAVATLPTDESVRFRIGESLAFIAELPGVERHMCLVARPIAAVLDGVEQPGIERPGTWYCPWHATVRGTLVERDESPLLARDETFAVVDVGIGSIYVDEPLEGLLPDSALPLEPGTAVVVEAAPIAVWDAVP